LTLMNQQKAGRDMLKRVAVTAIIACSFVVPAYGQSGDPTGTQAGSPAPLPANPAPSADPVHDLHPQTARSGDCPLRACAPGRWWFTAEGMVAWVEGAKLPPLVTTSPAGTARASAGVLGQDSTTVLFGNSEVNEDVRGGYRLELGYWLDCEHTFGLKAGFFMLGDQDAHFSATSQGDPILARPFINALTGAQTAQLIAFPRVASGSVDASYSNQDFLGVNIDAEECTPLCCCPGVYLRAFFGYRYLSFRDKLAITTDQTAEAGSAFVAGTEINATDRFSTFNMFHGFDLGVASEYRANSLTLGMSARLGVGNTHRSVSISGATHT